ncbi:E3 ubiquitin-protein ligase RNF166-like [Malaya genurostris]|uniref:E3 ubiquitin-protein ligase RNF166-like n=1 Tax=Malaya genurostris TaxID=325434 RepID=UPI0026F3D914|nr:E3 ubiquitin-protein ligase RNF166-like [Malaya genurostris]
MSVPVDPSLEDIASPQKSDVSCCSDTNSSFSRNRYNLRNRGPATFCFMAERECPICLSDVFEKPVVVNCGHTFCGKCIRLSMIKFKNCPICNQILIRSLFLWDTSYTKRLTRKRSPVRPYTRTQMDISVKAKQIKQEKDAIAVLEQDMSDRKVYTSCVASGPNNDPQRTRL